MLRIQPGIHSVKVALLAERAVVEYDPEKWTDEKIMSVSITDIWALTVHMASRAILSSMRSIAEL